MSTSESDNRRYQFSLGSLLLFTAFIAVVCSIGVATYWPIAFAVLFGVPLGIAVARAKEGVVVCGFQFLLIAVVGCVYVFVFCSGPWQFDWQPPNEFWVAIVIAVPMGCIYGHFIADASKIRRRWLQTIPMTLLLLLVLDGVDLKWNAMRQERTIAAIKKLGGSITIRDPLGRIVGCVSIQGPHFTDADLEPLLDLLKDVPLLKTLELTDTKVTDDGVKQLKRSLPNCEIYSYREPEP